jgi:homoserine dehydrogenase
MRQIGVGIVGFGTVGAGVVDGLQRNRGKLAERLGIDIVLRRVADLDIATDRGVSIDPAILTTDARNVVGDPSIDIVVELIGGCGIARKLVREALEAGQSVVTANKKLLAEHGAELFELAESKGVDLYFGASVGGGIPIIRTIREALSGNEVESILGILNGTCNYILTRMEAEGLSFDVALAAAQKEGYAEADPTLDVDGFDTLHKAAILAALAYGFTPDVKTLAVTGIRGVVDAADIRYAKELGYRIKLLGIIRGQDGEVEVRVAPTLVPEDSMLGSVDGVFNAVLVKCDLAGTTLYYGRGAGRLPTASTVIGDIADVAFNRVHNAPLKVIIPKSSVPVRLKPTGEVQSRHYLRVAIKDEVGTMAKVASVLAANGVSIASVLQKDMAQTAGAFVPVIILTHRARQANMDAALAEIARLDIIGAHPVRLGIE